MRVGPDDVEVTGQRGDGRLEADAAVGHIPRRDLLPVHEQHSGHHFLRADVEAHAVPRLQRPRGVGEELEGGVDEQGGHEPGRRSEHVPALSTLST